MSWTLLSTSQPVARKEYLCEWCPERIQVGEKHAQYAGVMDGYIQNTRMHLECLDASHREWDSWNEELCQERHLRGMTCDETEAARAASSPD